MLYKSAYNQVQEISAEIEQIKRLLEKAYYYKDQKDFNACLWMLRNTLEAICKNIYKIEISPDINDIELRNIIKKIDIEGKVPKNILLQIRNVQNFGNYGAHNENDGNNKLSDVDINPPLLSMDIVFKWFINEYHGISEEIKIGSKDSSTSSSPKDPYISDNDTNPQDNFTDKGLSPEVIFIVLRFPKFFGIIDRFPAELLRKRIDDIGNNNKNRRAIIIKNGWEQSDTFKYRKNIIWFTKEDKDWEKQFQLSKNKSYKNDSSSTNLCRVIKFNNTVLFMTKAPGGTLEAAKKFIEAEEGLKKFLSIAWEK